MAELFNRKRAIFSVGRQRAFFDKIGEKLSIERSAEICNVSERTIRDWRREKFSVDLKALHILCKKTNIPFPYSIQIKDRYWYVLKGARNGGLALFKKYGRICGDLNYRKKKWHEWWEKEGKYNFIVNTPLFVKEPRRSEELAEFVGIVLGDGGISQYQVTITFHSEDEQEYSKFVINLIKKLFNAPISIYDKKIYRCFEVKISRVNLVRFLVRNLGLKMGNKVKQRVDIPDWIKKNRQYSIACVRGLIDTDGCVVNHRYFSRGKRYSYKKISFTSHSEPLREAVFRILKEIGLSPRLAKYNDVWIDRQESVKQYFKIVGFHNEKHLKRYKN